jgi:oligosaccharide repeat unit polymerase
VVLIFTNKDTSTLGGSMAAIITYFVVGYIVSPTAALDFVLEHARDYAAEPNRTFKFPLSVGSALHLWPYTPPPFLDRFIYVPIPTNVYTGYKFYFTDFGFAGALVSVAMIAGLECLLYRKALTGSVLGRYLFAYTMFPLVMFVFDDAFAATGQMLNALLFGCIYLWLRTTVRVLPGRGPRAMAFPRIGLRLLPRRRLSAE